MAERRLLLGARLAGGAVAAGVAAVTIAVVGLVPLPTLGAGPRSVTVDPAPAGQVRVCPGAVLRLGDAIGSDAASAFVIGSPAISPAATGADLERERLASAEDGAPASAAPEVLRVPPADDALIAGAQHQNVDAPDYRGLSAATCEEPSGSIWLVGGATTVGRTTVLLLSNPTETPARVDLEIFGEGGPVTSPGMTGIVVAPGSQRALSLAGFAPGLTSPVVHVASRGGRVVAGLQQSIVRGLSATGVETTGGAADPATGLVIPGVRIVDSVGVSRASALADWHDVMPAIRVGVPGAQDASVTVRVVPQDPAADGSTFRLDIAAGTVTEVPLDAGASDIGSGEDGPGEDDHDDHSHGLGDGMYAVYVESDVPVVAAVRASTAVDRGSDAEGLESMFAAPRSDLAWFPAAPALTGATLVVVPGAPSPVIAVANPGDSDAVVEVAARSGDAPPVELSVPAGSTASVAVSAGAYLLTGAEGLSVSVSFAAPGLLAATVVAPPRPVAGPIVIRPD